MLDEAALAVADGKLKITERVEQAVDQVYSNSNKPVPFVTINAKSWTFDGIFNIKVGGSYSNHHRNWFLKDFSTSKRSKFSLTKNNDNPMMTIFTARKNSYKVVEMFKLENQFAFLI